MPDGANGAPSHSGGNCIFVAPPFAAPEP